MFVVLLNKEIKKNKLFKRLLSEATAECPCS